MTTLILGRASNLTQVLHPVVPDAVVVSARELMTGARLPLASGEPCSVIINAFQPATALRDVSDPVGYVERAIGVTAKLLEALREHRVAKVIYTSSASVYGDSVACRETDRTSASGLHAGLKLAAESLVRQVCEARGVDFTIARLFNMYGGDDQFSVLSKVIAAARNGTEMTLTNHGNAIRDFIHVDDVARVYTVILTTPAVPIVNVASGVGVSIRNVVDALAIHGHAIRTRSVSRPDEIRISTANVELLNTLVDTRGFRQAIDHVIAGVEA
jgi:nucleoside-diphosphate-sugar epimerase